MTEPVDVKEAALIRERISAENALLTRYEKEERQAAANALVVRERIAALREQLRLIRLGQ